MTYQPAMIPDDQNPFPPLPRWVSPGAGDAPEDVAFLSGAALGSLHPVLARPDVPLPLLRERLALQAAEASVTFLGHGERAADLRDAVQFLHPGDRAGPAGEVYQAWQRAVERPVSVRSLHRALPVEEAEEIAAWLDTGRGCPVARAADVLEAVLADRPQAVATALILADATLSKTLGWRHCVPILSPVMKRRDLRLTGAQLRLACHRAAIAGAGTTFREAAELTRRAERLRAIAPKLRARGAADAVDMFLSRDAVAPSALQALLRSDRAARRLCDRLVELGTVRELTGRDTFRLYGL